MKGRYRQPTAAALLFLLALALSFQSQPAAGLELRPPIDSGTSAGQPGNKVESPGRTSLHIEPRNLPDFAPSQAVASPGSGTALQGGLESGTLPTATRLTLIVEYPIDAKTSQPGDIFEGSVKRDLYLGRTLLLPRGSMVRGRIAQVKKPRLISRAGKVGLRLEQIVTPTGEVIPLDAQLEFQKGVTNRHGQLDPGTGFGTRVENSLRTVTGLNSSGSTRSALLAANIATLGAPAAATLIGSSAVALFQSGDNVSVRPGEEIEILLTDSLGVQLN